MKQIEINGELLPVPIDSELIAHSENPQLSNLSVDSYTVDFDLPRTADVERVLDVWGLLDRGQLFGTKIDCRLLTDNGTEAATLQVVEVTETAVRVCLFANDFSALLEQQVNRIVTDSSATIKTVAPQQGWDVAAADVAFYEYVNAQGVTVDPTKALRFPAIRLSYLLGLIQTKTGVTMPTVDNDLYLLANNNIICPQYDTQLVYASLVQSIATAHVCAKSTNPLLIQKNATANITITSTGDPLNPQIKVIQYRNGNIVDTITATVGTTTTGTLNVQEGDTILVSPQHSTTLVWVQFVWSGYDINEADYAEVDYGAGDKQSPVCGVIANIGEMTLKDLLNALQWYTGKALRITASGFTLANSRPVDHIDARIMSYRPTSDIFGQATIVTYKGGREQRFAIPSEWLPLEKVMHESIFQAVNNDDNGIAVVNQYEQNGTKVKVTFSKTPVLAVLNASYQLTAPADLQTAPFGSVKGAVEVTAETYDPVDFSAFVEVDGRTYCPLSGDTDKETNRTTLKMILL